MSKAMFSLQKVLLCRGFLQIPSELRIQLKYFSSSSIKYKSSSEKQDNQIENAQQKSKSSLPNEAVFHVSKEDMYVCWHPEVKFPYEMTKPIPTEAPITQSNLKIQALTPVREVFRKKDSRLFIRELMKLTYTAKYKWMGMHGRKKKLVFRDMDPLKEKRDRDYL